MQQRRVFPRSLRRLATQVKSTHHSTSKARAIRQGWMENQSDASMQIHELPEFVVAWRPTRAVGAELLSAGGLALLCWGDIGRSSYVRWQRALRQLIPRLAGEASRSCAVDRAPPVKLPIILPALRERAHLRIRCRDRRGRTRARTPRSRSFGRYP